MRHQVRLLWNQVRHGPFDCGMPRISQQSAMVQPNTITSAIMSASLRVGSRARQSQNDSIVRIPVPSSFENRQGSDVGVKSGIIIRVVMKDHVKRLRRSVPRFAVREASAPLAARSSKQVNEPWELRWLAC